MDNKPTGTVTFLFTDIEGSTKLAQENPGKWEALRERHHTILQSAMEAHNGYIFQIIGDAFCVAFHTAGDALRAALKSQEDLYNENWDARPIKVRMGIHTGNAQAVNDNDQSGGYKAYASMARVQRLMSAAHGGQVLISLTTEELLRDDLPDNVSLRDMGERRLKDLIRPEHIYQLVISNLPDAFPPIKTLDAYRHNLPIQLTSFVGREKEMGQIAQSIGEHRLVTLTGVGGTGKTRLALQVAADLTEQFPDGVWFVELASISDPELIPQTILTTFGISEQPARTILQMLTDYFRERNLLLVLDNCEHLIQASAILADTLLNNSHSLKIMATSREALGVKGEATWHVPSLSLPDIKHLPTLEQLTQYEAVQLFTERALLVQPNFIVTNDNTSFVAQICCRLDGIPLAIELAASRIRALSVDQIATRLDDRFRLLTGGSRTALERHQTLRATIDWSYNLLSAEEKILLRSLSVFVGGWTLEAAESVCSQEAGGFDILGLLTQLVDKSLVISHDSRYHMLETTHQYAREKLFESEEVKTLRDQHLAYFLGLAQQADKELHGPNQLEWLSRLDTMRDNLRAALEWAIESGQPEAALQMARRIHWFWVIRSDHTEGRQWLQRVLHMPDTPLHPEAHAEALNQLVHHIYLQIGIHAARPYVEQALSIAGAHADKHNTARALSMLGLVLANEKNFGEAQSALKESQALYQEVDDEWGYAHAVMCHGWESYLQNDHATSLSLSEQALALFKKHGDGYFASVTLRLIGMLQVKQGNWANGVAILQESLILAQKLDSKYESADALSRLGEAAQQAGKPARAVRLYWAARNLFDSIGAWGAEDESKFENRLVTCRAALSESEFEAAAEQGRGMTMEEAIEYALEETK